MRQKESVRSVDFSERSFGRGVAKDAKGTEQRGSLGLESLGSAVSLRRWVGASGGTSSAGNM